MPSILSATSKAKQEDGTNWWITKSECLRALHQAESLAGLDEHAGKTEQWTWCSDRFLAVRAIEEENLIKKIRINRLTSMEHPQQASSLHPCPHRWACILPNLTDPQASSHSYAYLKTQNPETKLVQHKSFVKEDLALDCYTYGSKSKRTCPQEQQGAVHSCCTSQDRLSSRKEPRRPQPSRTCKF